MAYRETPPVAEMRNLIEAIVNGDVDAHPGIIAHTVYETTGYVLFLRFGQYEGDKPPVFAPASRERQCTPDECTLLDECCKLSNHLAGETLITARPAGGIGTSLLIEVLEKVIKALVEKWLGS